MLPLRSLPMRVFNSHALHDPVQLVAQLLGLGRAQELCIIDTYRVDGFFKQVAMPISGRGVDFSSDLMAQTCRIIRKVVIGHTAQGCLNPSLATVQITLYPFPALSCVRAGDHVINELHTVEVGS
jgi:hypothetical protein